MSDIVHQRQSLDQIDIQPKLRRNGARDLRDFHRVGQAVAKMVGITAGEDLGFGFQPAKRPRVDDSVAVALKIVAVGMGRLGKTASAGLFHPHRVVGEHGRSLAEAVSYRLSALSPGKKRAVRGNPYL